MRHKLASVIEIKSLSDEGGFTALVAPAGNVDLHGDRVLPGAFTKTLERWRESGDPIPVVLAHDWDNPFSHLGVADPQDIHETTKGLVVKGKLDVEDNDVARQVHRLMKRRSLKAFSYGYTVPEGGEKVARDGAKDLSEIDLVEIGPCLKGVNPKAEVLAVKSALTGDTLETGSPADLTLEDRVDRLEKALLPQVKSSAPEQVHEDPIDEDPELTPGKSLRQVEFEVLQAEIETLIPYGHNQE
jgi:hypothetical protein